ncbi:MAG TPA: hypothetical protein VFH43_10245 [Candidatus Kapabacteria bacterium]|nr:hypothetical protein [Candidatus Kapabacteria bacterium]
MTNLFRNLGFGALLITGFIVSDASAQAMRPMPPRDMSTGVPRNAVAASNFVKTGPTIVPVVDSNAILNLDYKEMRSAPAAVNKPALAVKPAVVEPTLAELKLQLKTAEDEYKATKLAYTQAVRSKDNVRVGAAKVNRAAAQQKVVDLKRAIAAKQPVAKKRAAPKKKSGGAARTVAAPAATAK